MPERASYDRKTVHAILDEGWACHLGVCVEGRPTVLPMLYVRDGDVLYLHGAPANAGLRAAEASQAACVSVTLVDALVIARSAFHHSVNYRSVVAFGPASEVTSLEEKERALLGIVDHVAPGRAGEARPPTANELRATRVTRFEIEEASAKIRTGGPKEEPEDLPRDDIWAGVVPLVVKLGEPAAEGALRAPLPAFITGREPGQLTRARN